MTDAADRWGPGATGKHGKARQLVDAALRAADPDEAARLLDDATRTDPEATAAAFSEARAIPLQDRVGDASPASDAEVAAEGAGAPGATPSRAGITGPGSGADGERR